MLNDTSRPQFNGADYDPALDHARLTKQIGRVFSIMVDGHWHTLSSIGTLITKNTGCRDPEASISAQLRHLRKPRFGAHNITRQRTKRNEALWEYRLAPKPDTQGDLFNV